MTIFIILFLVLFLILIFQIIRLIYFAIKKKELSKEVKKTCIVFLCNVFAFILVGMTAPENIKNKAKESGIKNKAEKVKEVKKKVDKEKKQVKLASQDDLKYEVLKNSRDTSNLTKKENTIDILVKDNISEENLKKVMRKAGKEQIKDADILFIRAYGDKKFFNLGGETHGMITYYPDGTVKDETYTAKKEIPSDKEKDIYIDYSKTLHETLKSKGNYTKQEEENIEEKINKKIAKKYGISPEEVEKIFDKVVIYQGM
ncbi:hypothetical protein JCM16776_0756 [Leptotrichia shahii]|uniref:Uncharacterized protein n=1 Tax=Leptotrichia shahii TaxID=157691 RepID=A0A510JMU6_9FUSO|nr:hypothetical protein [Leptotrichia shahii]BBM40536.1 hypothetical protein JCM16776_0756 [Leptotrichia shahii]